MKDGGEAMRAAKPDHIYLDHMGFGMGCCCLQVTFQVLPIFGHILPVIFLFNIELRSSYAALR